jgi:hypothetical protein
MLLITTFVELRVVARRSRTRAGRSHAVSGRLMLIYTCHSVPMPRCAVALKSCFQNGMVVAWHRRGTAYVNQTRPPCVNQMGKTISKPLAARQCRGTAWKRHGMCDLALKSYRTYSATPTCLQHIKYNTKYQYVFICYVHCTKNQR